MIHKLSCPADPGYYRRTVEAGGIMGLGDSGNGKCNCGAEPVRTNHFTKLMQEAQELATRKAHDYSNEDRYSNFKRAAEVLSWFNNPIDQVFACMIAIKIARLAELRNGKEAKNESTRDSHIDLINYSGLWGSYYDSLPKPVDDHQTHVDIYRSYTAPKQQAQCSTCGKVFDNWDEVNFHVCTGKQ